MDRPLSFEEFLTRLMDAYEHLYDLAYLRSQPLTALFSGGQPGTPKDHAWITHHLLLDVIQELDPGNAPISSREWRRHRLMILRYADGLTAQAVADRLAISRRHYYRAHEEAMRAVASILWSRISEGDSLPEAPVATPEKAVGDRMELLRLEAAQLSRVDQRSDIVEVLHGVLTLLETQTRQHRLEITLDMQPVPPLSTDPRLLRQLLLALPGYLIERASDGTIHCAIDTIETSARLKIQVTELTTLRFTDEVDSTMRLAALEELAVLCGASLTSLRRANTVSGFEVSLPLLKSRHTVLLVDDNDDILELVSRYLRFNHYDVVPAKTSQEAVEIAASAHPSAIVLDLMMPDRDGWDLLQYFSHQPQTQATPIIICSVLRQKELALSLGASAFIEKPVSEQDLIQILRQVIEA